MKKDAFKSILILVVTSWIAHFLYIKNFGFYEDDYINIPQCLNADFSSFFNLIIISFSEWLQGHPLAFVPFLITIIGTSLGGLQTLYIIAFLIVTLNSVLMYFILRKVYPGSQFFCITGALIFCLFPPDTAKILLIHAYVLQVSLMYFLISTLLYLNGWKVFSYIIILMSLFSYESAFMLFYGVPLLKILKTNFNKKIKKELIVNFFILSSFLIFSFLYRKFTGEGRIAELSGNMIESLYKAGVSVFLGPLMNAYLFLRGSAVALLHLNNVIVLTLLIFFTIFFLLFYKSKSVLNKEFIEKPFSFSFEMFRLKGELAITKSNSDIIKLILVSIVFLGLAYTLSFTHYPPTIVAGRLTSVHMAATFGGSMFFACFSLIIFDFTSRNGHWKRIVFIIIISGYLSLLVGYRLVIQNDFVQSWKNQKSFWTQVTNLCPDLSDSTVIFVMNNQENKLPVTSYISSNSWADPIILNQLYKFPEAWKNAPRLYVLGSNLESRVKVENDELKWKVPFGAVESHMETLPDSNIILLYVNSEKELVRSDSEFISLKGKNIHLKPGQNNIISSFEKGKLHDFLISKEQ